jgi:hypothetical protein
MRPPHAPLSIMRKHGYKGPRESHGAGLGGFRNAKRSSGASHEGTRGAKRPRAAPPGREARGALHPGKNWKG